MDVFYFELAFCNEIGSFFFLSESIKLEIWRHLHFWKTDLMNAYCHGRKKEDLQAEGYPAITPSAAVMGV